MQALRSVSGPISHSKPSFFKAQTCGTGFTFHLLPFLNPAPTANATPFRTTTFFSPPTSWAHHPPEIRARRTHAYACPRVSRTPVLEHLAGVGIDLDEVGVHLRGATRLREKRPPWTDVRRRLEGKGDEHGGGDEHGLRGPVSAFGGCRVRRC